jgi:hypothetical protein
VSFDEVAGVGTSVGVADDEVGVDLRFAVLDGDVAGERRNLDLLVDRDWLVLLPLPVEVAERDVAEGADAGEVSGGELVLACESLQFALDLVAAREDECVASLAVDLAEGFRFRARSPASFLALFLVASVITPRPAETRFRWRGLGTRVFVSQYEAIGGYR